MSGHASQSRPSHLFYQSEPRRPLVERAEGIYIWDRNGKRYIDGSSGAMVMNIGHGNKRVLDAMREQMEKATFAYRLHFENEPAEELARRTSGYMPGDLKKLFFVSGGSEAIETCFKMARQYALAIGQTARYKIISRFPSYHGATFGSLAVTGYDALTKPFAPMLQEMPKIRAPTAYLDRDDLSTKQRGERYAGMLEDKILSEGTETVLGFVMEPIGGASTGALVAPDTYYSRVRDICTKYGVLLIHDEVMSGVGRTGRFLGGDHWGCIPDLIALSKGFGSGYMPLGAMVASNQIVDAVQASGGFQHGFTYAGNPLACAAGLAVLKEIEQEALIENTATGGAQLKAELERLAERFPFIGDVRGLGFLLAAEFVSDRETMAPLPKELNAYQRAVDIAYDLGLIIYSRRTRGGVEGDHILVCPPMITTKEQVDEIIGILGVVLLRLARELNLPISS
ncbi:MAG: aspartate aminotransferase family protein [Mesorhizobium sp.]|nr:MAG: aspartate aminotransferase family protein [Mesorhizobium sp.]